MLKKLKEKPKLLPELFVLSLIFFLAFWIRAVNIVPDRILSYDPVYQYRFTKYFVDFGVFPAWDELSYYTGRAFYMPPLMYYLTALIYWFLKALMSSITLKTACSLAGALYGALMVIPAYLLTRELASAKAGLLAALFVGTAPQILTRTFGASYDTDQLVLFFILLTLWTSFRLFRNPNYFNFMLSLFAFTGFMFTWNMFWYTFYIYLGVIFLWITGNAVSYLFFKGRFPKREIIAQITTAVLLFVSLNLAGELNGLQPLRWFFEVIGFAVHPETWIVNVSIAELQPIWNLVTVAIVPFLVSGALIFALGRKLKNLENFALIFATTAACFIFVSFISYASTSKTFSLSGFRDFTASYLLYSGYGHVAQFLGNFTTGEFALDLFILVTLFSSAFFALYSLFTENYKSKRFVFVLVLWIFFFLTIKGGIRFTEYVSAIGLCLAATGLAFLKAERDILKTLTHGLIIILALVSVSCGIYLGYRLGPDIDANWDNAWKFLREQTPELALVGTWWDPGHMITGYAERRVIADGAHCGFDCMYTINDRITDLGKIFTTKSEKEALKILRKYQGTSPEIYWIASFDLIGKFQWLQYFGTGCDARVEYSKCPLYNMLQLENAYAYTGGNLTIYLFDYGAIKVLYLNYPIAFYVQGKNAMLFKEVLYYENNSVQESSLEKYNATAIYDQLSPIFKAIGYRLTKQFFPWSVWISRDKSVVVTIPPHLREALFTKMFMLEGKGLKNFELVLSNPEVKIYRVKNLEEGWKN